MKYFKLATSMMKIQLNKDLAYKTNLFIMIFAKFISDIIGPLLGTLIYGSTQGIPGWNYYEFLLFQGTLIIVLGLGTSFAVNFVYDVMAAIESGEFDTYLIRPYNTWLYILSQSATWEGIPEILFGIIVVLFSIRHLAILPPLSSILLYTLILFVGLLFLISTYTIIAAGSIIAVKNESLVNFFHRVLDFTRYPLDIYGSGLKFTFTFLFPLAIASFYPATALLRSVNFATSLVIFLPTIAFFIVSQLIWHYSLKKYTSAGG